MAGQGPDGDVCSQSSSPRSLSRSFGLAASRCPLASATGTGLRAARCVPTRRRASRGARRRTRTAERGQAHGCAGADDGVRSPSARLRSTRSVAGERRNRERHGVAPAAGNEGADALGRRDAPCCVRRRCFHWRGTVKLAEREGAGVIVFGSEYRTAPGAVSPCMSAEYLLEGGSAVVAVASAKLCEPKGT
jgi:hypothetical protein